MTVRNITKQKACIEDFSLGDDTESQTRGGTALTLNKVNTGLIPGRGVSAADLADITADVNTTGKQKYACVWDTDADKPLWAAGSAAGDVWKDATGATVRTPV